MSTNGTTPPFGNNTPINGATPATGSGGSTPQLNTPPQQPVPQPSPSPTPTTTTTAQQNVPGAGGTTNSAATSSPNGTTPPTSTSLLSIFSNLSAEQKDEINRLAAHMASEQVANLAAAGLLVPPALVGQPSGGVPVSATKKPRIISEADEVVISSFDRPVEIAAEIETLWEEGFYIPIHLFTRDNLRTISEHRGSLLKKFTFNKDGAQKPATLGLLDVEHALLGRENGLSLILWIEAWDNYLTFMKTRFSPPLLERWRSHYNALVTRPEREDAFPALLAFDIEERRAYNHVHFKHDDSRWQFQLHQHIFDFRNAEVNQRLQELSRQPNNSRDRVASNSHSSASNGSRFAPYDRDRSQPFLSGKSRTLAAGTCIACGKPGHYARECAAKTTAANRPPVARAHPTNPKCLANIKDDKLGFCVSFNTRGPNACKPGSHGTNIKHACSICGDEHHHAAACSACVA